MIELVIDRSAIKEFVETEIITRLRRCKRLRSDAKAALTLGDPARAKRLLQRHEVLIAEIDSLVAAIKESK